jgi:hypothetical protein
VANSANSVVAENPENHHQKSHYPVAVGDFRHCPQLGSKRPEFPKGNSALLTGGSRSSPSSGVAAAAAAAVGGGGGVVLICSGTSAGFLLLLLFFDNNDFKSEFDACKAEFALASPCGDIFRSIVD